MAASEAAACLPGAVAAPLPPASPHPAPLSGRAQIAAYIRCHRAALEGSGGASPMSTWHLRNFGFDTDKAGGGGVGAAGPGEAAAAPTAPTGAASEEAGDKRQRVE